METKNLIIICITVIVLICLGVFLIANMNSQEETHITILTSQFLTEGDSLKLKLCDKDGNGIANETINISVENKNGNTDEMTIQTDEKGQGVISNIPKGNYTLTAIYGGSSKYDSYSLSYEFIVKAKKVETSSKSSSSIYNGEYATDYKVDDVIDGWDPSEHEVSREYVGNGNYRVHYDDGYSRVIDSDGNILSYGY